MSDLTNLKYRGGTPWSEAHDPDGNIVAIDTAITSKDKVITALGSMVDSDGDYAARSTTNYIDSNSDVDEDLTDLDGAIGDVVDGTTARTGVVKNTQNVGTAAVNVTAVEYGDGVQHTSVLTISGMTFGVTGAADQAIGNLMYTFPAGVHVHKVSYMSVALQGTGTVDLDTPEIGAGSTEATGAHATLGAAGATTEDYIEGSAAADCNGTATVVGPVGATAGILTGISLNAATDAKTLFLNISDGWAGADTVTASGTVVLEWTTLA